MKRLSITCIWIGVILLLPQDMARSQSSALLFKNLGTYDRAFTTPSAEAQRYLDQDLLLYSGFNHEEAVRSFTAATVFDPACAMGYWGIALSLGAPYQQPRDG